MSTEMATMQKTKGKKVAPHVVHERPNGLKAKVGAGGLPQGVFEKAQEAAYSMKDDCLKDVQEHLAEIALVLNQERFGDHEVLRARLSTLASEIFAFCGTCGLEVIGRIAKSLDRLALKPGFFDKQDFDLVEPHLMALAFAVNEFSQADATEDACLPLLFSLETAVENRCTLG